MRDIRDNMPLVFIGERAYYVIQFSPRFGLVEVLTQHGFKFMAPIAAVTATPVKEGK